jgi:hypothetical protein
MPQPRRRCARRKRRRSGPRNSRRRSRRAQRSSRRSCGWSISRQPESCLPPWSIREPDRQRTTCRPSAAGHGFLPLHRAAGAAEARRRTGRALPGRPRHLVSVPGGVARAPASIRLRGGLGRNPALRIVSLMRRSMRIAGLALIVLGVAALAWTITVWRVNGTDHASLKEGPGGISGRTCPARTASSTSPGIARRTWRRSRRVTSCSGSRRATRASCDTPLHRRCTARERRPRGGEPYCLGSPTTKLSRLPQ